MSVQNRHTVFLFAFSKHAAEAPFLFSNFPTAYLRALTLLNRLDKAYSHPYNKSCCCKLSFAHFLSKRQMIFEVTMSP